MPYEGDRFESMSGPCSFPFLSCLLCAQYFSCLYFYVCQSVPASLISHACYPIDWIIRSQTLSSRYLSVYIINVDRVHYNERSGTHAPSWTLRIANESPIYPRNSCDYTAGYFCWCPCRVHRGDKIGGAISLCVKKSPRKSYRVFTSQPNNSRPV